MTATVLPGNSTTRLTGVESVAHRLGKALVDWSRAHSEKRAPLTEIADRHTLRAVARATRAEHVARQREADLRRAWTIL